MDTRADIANESNRKLYQNHLSSLAKLREARLRIQDLERELAEERHSREVASAKAWEFAARIEALEKALREQNCEPPPEV
jgi:hypothetical protein